MSSWYQTATATRTSADRRRKGASRRDEEREVFADALCDLSEQVPGSTVAGGRGNDRPEEESESELPLDDERIDDISARWLSVATAKATAVRGARDR